jgi:DNA-binding transcriptional LysR family regulator
MLRAFEAVGRTGGIRKAALALEIDHAVVSRHLRALEQFVGTALVDRNSGTRLLTSDGVEYHRRISAAFQEISGATQMLRKRHDRRLLIWCSPGLAYHWLAPRLSGFATAYPGIEIELRPIDYGPNFATNEADGDIRYFRIGGNDLPAAGTQRVELVRPPVFPVASPTYAESIAGRLRTPADLLDLRLLHEESDTEWRAWLGEQGMELDPASLPGPRLWHAHVMLDAARSGEGIALANPLLVDGYLGSGQLVPLQASDREFQPVPLGGYSFTAREDRWRDLALQRFRSWLHRSASLTAESNALVAADACDQRE